MTLILPQPKTKPRTPVLDRSHRLARGLVGAWLFNEGGGDVLRDYSGNEYNGTLGGAVYDAGPTGAELYTDGTNDKVRISGIPYAPQITAMVWANPGPNHYGDNNTLISRTPDAGAAGDFMFYGDDTNNDKLTLDIPWVLGDIIQGPTNSWVEGKYAWYGFTRSGTTGDWTYKLWKNGEEIASATTGSNPNTSPHDLKLGWMNNTFPFYGENNFAAALFWHRTISPDEIAELYSDPWSMWRRQSTWGYSPAEPAVDTTTVSFHIPQPKTKPRTPVLDRSHRLARGLIGGWLANGGIDFFRDYSGHGLDAPINAAAGGSVIGPRGEAVNLTSSTNYATVADNGDGIFDSQDITLCWWVRPNANKSDQALISYDKSSFTNPYYCYHLRLDSSARIYFGWNDGVQQQSIGNSETNAYTVGEWQMITATHKKGEQRIWVNDYINSSGTDTGTITWFGQPVWLGKSQLADDGDFALGSFHAWRRVLSDDEIRELYSDPWSMWRRQSTWGYSPAEPAAASPLIQSPAAQRIRMSRHGTYLRT